MTGADMRTPQARRPLEGKGAYSFLHTPGERAERLRRLTIEKECRTQTTGFCARGGDPQTVTLTP